MSLDNDREQRLDRLWPEYRAACPDMEGGANFMPNLWMRIESRRNPVLQWATMSRRALAGALALCLVLVVMHFGSHSPLFYQATYVEVLDDNSAPEDLASMQPISFEGSSR